MKKLEKVKILLIVVLTLTFFSGFVHTYNIYNPDSVLSFVNEPPTENTLFENLTYISGAVENPGVYTFNEGERIIDIINKAGGFNEDADLEFINRELNLSAKIEDEQQIFIPYLKNEIMQDNSLDTIENTSSNLININTASKYELESIPGVGPSTAQKIIDGRPYLNIEDLLNISGIGDSKFEAMEDFISVE